jgi:hypothetical protein
MLIYGKCEQPRPNRVQHVTGTDKSALRRFSHVVVDMIRPGDRGHFHAGRFVNGLVDFQHAFGSTFLRGFRYIEVGDPTITPDGRMNR